MFMRGKLMRYHCRRHDLHADERHEHVGHGCQRHAVVDLHILQRAGRHARLGGVARFLHDSDATVRLDRLQSRRAIVEPACQYDAHHGRTHRHGGRSEQRIDGRSSVVLLRTAAQPQSLAFDKQVMVRRRDADAPRDKRLAVGRMRCLQWPGGRQQRGHDAPVAADVQDDQQRCRKACRQPGHQRLQRLHPARGCTDHDQAGRLTAR
jgi:hypothetical protein